MVEPETLTFLSDLAANNRKIWLDANRDARDDAMRNFTGIAMTLHDYAERFDPFVAQTRLKPKQSYSKFFQEPRDRVGKGLYRTDVDIFANAGNPTEDVGYYLHIEPGNCHAGAGVFHPTKDAVAGLRARMLDDPSGFHDVLAAPDFKAAFPGGIVTRKPQGDLPDTVAPDHALAPYLQMVGFGCRHDLSDEQVQDHDIIDDLIDIFRAASGLVRFFD